MCKSLCDLGLIKVVYSAEDKFSMCTYKQAASITLDTTETDRPKSITTKHELIAWMDTHADVRFK